MRRLASDEAAHIFIIKSWRAQLPVDPWTATSAGLWADMATYESVGRELIFLRFLVE
ncbi:hypothetical protein BRAS3843_470016 [Bradyrhizobium sp. STM 3843]|nr:hypothetical protein BRAS3843_470016 [Bradyrhizobium sp. STM 3843]